MMEAADGRAEGERVGISGTAESDACFKIRLLCGVENSQQLELAESVKVDRACELGSLKLSEPNDDEQKKHVRCSNSDYRPGIMRSNNKDSLLVDEPNYGKFLTKGD